MSVCRLLILLMLLCGSALAQETQPTVPFTPEQQAWIDARLEPLRLAAQPRYTLKFDVLMKGLYQNDQSNGSVWLGNPHPEGDNYSGTNGVASVLSVHIDGRVNPSITAGARLETRFGQQFADFYENGDLRVDASGRPSGVDATGESLGMNHAAYAQLRGIYIQWDRPNPIPTVTSLRAGSSDLGHFNPWTIGRIRFIDRDNAKGFFVIGQAPAWNVDYNLARVALPKLYASAGFNTGIADPLVENPFWARDAAYAGKLHFGRNGLDATLITTYLLDEEADLDDPDALGSTNLIDKRDGVVTTIPRYANWNATLEVDAAWQPAGLSTELLVGVSRSDPDMDLVFNTIDGNQGLSPIPLKTVSGYAVRLRGEGRDLGGGGLTLRGEYFNVGADWVATLGSRREEDVLLTEGFLDGQLPTLNIANEFMDFTEPFYETIVGWHGATLKPGFVRGPLSIELEGTFITYNTNGQDRCTSKDVPGCEQTGGQYPDFLFPDGMTDTDFFTFANTNDRGRDPRAAYRTNQERVTWIGAARIGRAFGPSRRGRVELRLKLIRDRDLRDTSIDDADDYLGDLATAVVTGAWKLSPEVTLVLGAKLDRWDEKHRSGSVVAGEPRYPDYLTMKSKLWIEGRYQLAQGTFFSYRMEYLNKKVDATDDALDFSYEHVVRSLAMLYAGF